MALIGYCRVSSTGQSLEIQEAQLTEAGCEEIFSEKRSGTSTARRDQLDLALRFVRKGDILVVTRLDRLARSISDLSKIIDQLAAKQVGFRCLQQGAVDTTKPEGRLMLQLLGCFAEFETAIRKERQREGIEKAKSEGRYRGRPKSIDPASIAALEAQGHGPAAIAKHLGIGRASVYRLRNDGASSGEGKGGVRRGQRVE